MANGNQGSNTCQFFSLAKTQPGIKPPTFRTQSGPSTTMPQGGLNAKEYSMYKPHKKIVVL